MFLIRRADVAQSGKPAPTLLYGYGGFNISLTPDFSATRLARLEQGGAVAIANLPGGSGYGASWHDAGRPIGSASGRGRGGQAVEILGGGGSLKKKNKKT